MKLPGAVLVAPTHSPGTAGWGFHLREGERHATRHHDPFKPELGCHTDNGRADYSALFHHRLHFT
jgi:ribonuclease HI